MAEKAETAETADPATQFHADRLAKWEAGRAEHGPEWGGHPGGPLAEIYFEQLDSWNYAEAALQAGQIDKTTANRWKRRALLWGVEILAKRSE